MTCNLSLTRRDTTRSVFRGLNHVVVPALRAGVGSPLFPVGGGVVVLETTGRISGELRAVPLVATRRGDEIKLSTVRRDSQWVRNLEADPRGAVWLHGRRRPVTAVIDRGRVTVATVTLDDIERAA